ncbi:MAG: hypothetical protein ACI8PZ_003232 [Myxococcota bacterium]
MSTDDPVGRYMASLVIFPQRLVKAVDSAGDVGAVLATLLHRHLLARGVLVSTLRPWHTAPLGPADEVGDARGGIDLARAHWGGTEGWTVRQDGDALVLRLDPLPDASMLVVVLGVGERRGLLDKAQRGLFLDRLAANEQWTSAVDRTACLLARVERNTHLAAARDALGQVRHALYAAPLFELDLPSVLDRVDGWADRLCVEARRLTRWLADDADHEALADVAEHLACATTNRVFGPGAGLAEASGLPRFAMTAALLEALHRELRSGRSAAPARVLGASRLLSGVAHPRATLDDSGTEDQLRLTRVLGLAAAAHRVAHDQLHADGQTTASDEALWGTFAAVVRTDLAVLLAGWVGDGAPLLHPDRRANTGTTSVKNWLRLWFAHRCLCALPSATDGSNPPPWQVREAIAYVVREALRYRLYGFDGAFEYALQPSDLAAALQELVVFDAGRHVPAGLNVRAHLRTVGRSANPDGYLFAAGHLQHVLELYMAGHMVLSIEPVGGDGGHRTIEAHLVAGASAADPTGRALDLASAFSIAALFHDVGMVLFPRAIAASALQGDDAVARELGAVGGAIEGAGRALVATCRTAVAGITSAAAEPGVASWIEQQHALGRPRHSLLSTWYFLRASERVRGLSPDVRRAAARAILLHACTWQPISVDADPAAALLALCDEVFDWEPSVRAGPAAHAIGHSPQVMATELGARESRARRIVLRGLAARVEPTGALRLTLDVASRSLWPRFDVELVSPLHLGTPSHRPVLTMAQNLSRVRAGSSGFGPFVRVALRTHPHLAARSTRTLLLQALRETSDPVAAEVLAWIEAGGTWLVPDPATGRSRWEFVYIRPAENCLSRGGLRRALEEIDARFGALLKGVSASRSPGGATPPPPPGSTTPWRGRR